MIFIILIGIVGVLYGWYQFYPSFGAKPDPSSWLHSKNYHGKIFLNQIPTVMKITAQDIISLTRERRANKTLLQPRTPLQPDKINLTRFLESPQPQLIWLGHSTVLLRVDGKTLLTDPILSMRSSPFRFIGPKRTISEIPLAANELPRLDAVLISHDHYDHLDYETIRQLAGKTTTFYVPLGVAAHLLRWGIKRSQIIELDWGQTADFGGMKITCTPSRHFSGRGIGDRFKTLWCSWVIQTAQTKIYFSGDTGYGPHFKDIGRTYGPFDLTLMECGQYDTRWANIHMTPEQTVQAHLDLKGERLFPIHWGAFVLALHPWADSVIRARAANLPNTSSLISARIGEILPFMTSPAETHPWWENETG